jgi:hypothetical protein
MKESDGNHYIQRFTFDVELERQSDAKPVQDRLSAMFKNRIQGMLEKLLDELDDPNFIVKIDTIEVDLGEITEGEVETRLYYKIKEALEKKIQKRVNYILSTNTPDSREGSKVPLAPAKMELLTFFLEQGRMPSGGEVFKQSIEEIFQELLEDYPEDVKALLNKVLAGKPQVARRIVRQFGSQTFESLIRLIAPAHVFYIRSQEQEIVDRSVELVEYGRSTVREEARIALLRYLFASPDQRFSIQSYQEQMQRLLAERLGSPIATILKKSESKEDKEESLAGGEIVETQRHRALIVRALRRGVKSVSRSDLIAAWEFLVRKEPETLRTAIGSYGDSPVALLRLLEELPVSAIRLMVRNVVTQASEVVLEVVVAVIAAHAELKRGNSADERFVKAAYAALIHELAVEGRIGLAQEVIAEAILKNLKAIPDAPAELLDRWYELEIPGVRTQEQKKEDEQKEAIERARKKAKEEQDETRRKEFIAQKELQDQIREEAADIEEAAEIAGLMAEEADAGTLTLKERIQRAKEKLAAIKRQRRIDSGEPEEGEVLELTQAEREEKEKEELRKAREEDSPEVLKRKKEEEQRKRAEAEETEEEQELRKAGQKQREEEEEKRIRKAAKELEDEAAGIRKREEDPEWPLAVTRKEAEEEIAEARRQHQEQQDDGIIDARSIDQRPAQLPESLFGDEESEDKRRIGFAEPHDPTQDFDLATESARIEYIMYHFRYGTDPWWVRNLRQRDIQSLVMRLGKSDANNLADATRELIFKTPPSEYPKVAGRIIAALDEVQRMKYMELVVPDMIGFLATTTRALLLYFEAKESELSPPAHMASPQTFAWQLPLQYVMRYYSSSPNASEMLRYVLKETAAVLNIEMAQLVADLGEVAEKAMENGERRFAPFRTLLPEPDQEFDIPLPQFHPGAPEEIESESDEVRLQRIQEDERAARIARGEDVGEDPEGRTPTPGLEEEDEIKRKTGVSESDDEGAVVPESKDPDAAEFEVSESEEKEKQQIQQEKELPGEEDLEPESKEKPLAKDASGLKVPGEEDKEEKQKEAAAADAQEREAEQKEQEKREEAGKERKSIPGETPQEALIRLAEEREAIARKSREDWPGGEEPEFEPLLVSVAELLESESESIRIVEYYLRYGALPHQESERLSAEVFRKLVLEVMVRHERAYVRMLRNISDNLKVRLRLVSLGEQVAVQSILHLNWMAGSPMQPFLNAVLELIGNSGAPINADPIMEHAIFYVTSNSGASFKAVDYIKALFRYLERYYKVSQFEFVQWLIKKNEENSVSVKAILNEILEMIRLAEDRRQVRKKPDKPDEPRYGSAGIPEDVEIFVENAGMVMVWPFLQQYFQRLDLITEERLFKDEESMEKGAHMLQYMITKEQNAPEEKLFLNKLIVGLPLDYPMHLEVEITDDEKEMTESLLRSIADQWTMMKGAPPEQLRATFLVRDGIIKKDGENWLLQVDKKGYDLVLKRLPWGLAQIRVPWLEYLINVEWG